VFQPLYEAAMADSDFVPVFERISNYQRNNWRAQPIQPVRKVWRDSPRPRR